jgi:hypothetical protein
MSKILLLTTVFSLLGIRVFAQSSVHPRKSPKEIMELFCKMDTDGELLNDEVRREAADLFGSPLGWSGNQNVIVVSAYVLRGPDMHDDSAQFIVDYNVWGELDSSLRFTREEGRIPDKPIRDREYFDLTLTPLHNQVGDRGKMEVVRGPLEWRIEIIPPGPRVSVDAAIRYVTEMRDKSGDAATKVNATKAIAALKRLRAGVTEQPAANVQKTAQGVVEEFCHLDAEGKQLASDGWREVSAFFVQPGSLRREKVTIVRDFGLSNASISDETKADVMVEYLYVGELNSGTAVFEQALPANMKIRVDFDLILTVKRTRSGQVEAAEGTTEEASEPVTWKILGPVPEPHITLDAAIRYATEMRDKTSSAVIKKNAERTLAALKGQR